MEALSLTGRTIAVPETREIEVFAGMLERRGATVVRCPMVAILDAPDPAPVLAWSRSFASGNHDDLILLTGEGLRRIVACIDRHEPALRQPFVAALGPVRKVTRGPKPARALRELGLKSDIAADPPTTAGIIASLSSQELQGRRVGVQLYGTDPNLTLMEFLRNAGAVVSTVAPYVYANAADDQAIADLLARIERGEIDAIAFTSTPQVERLFAVGAAGASAAGAGASAAAGSTAADRVRAALRKTLVAAVGPIVADTLHKHGVESQLMPEDSFFLKPLTTVLEAALTSRS